MDKLKEYEVILHPKPFTTTVSAQFPWEALKIAEEKYTSDVARKVLTDGFDDYRVKEIKDGSNQPEAV